MRSARMPKLSHLALRYLPFSPNIIILYHYIIFNFILFNNLCFDRFGSPWRQWSSRSVALRAMALATFALEFQRQRQMQRALAARVRAFNAAHAPLYINNSIMLAIFLVLVTLQSYVGAEELLKYSELGTCLPDEFYNVNSLLCVKCSALANLVPSGDGNFLVFSNSIHRSIDHRATTQFNFTGGILACHQ